MAEPNKNQKFLEFYLTELLNHVKNTSEHRFQPAEFSAIKKTLVYLSHSQNPTERIDTLKNVPVLNPLHEFFTAVLNRFQDPAYRKSHMMAAIEVDSEKVSQMFAAIFQSQALRNDLVAQLPAIGITLQFRLSQETPEAKVLPAPEIKTPAETEKKTPASPVSDDFKRVGDMLGFLTSRMKKFVTPKEETATLPATEEPKESSAVSSLAEFKTAARRDLDEIQKALTRLQSNPERGSYIIELADATGSLKKTARLFEAMSVYETLRRIEKTLNDVADRVDDHATSVVEPSRKALDNLFQTIQEWSRSPETVTSEGLDASMKAHADEFHRHLAPAVLPEIRDSGTKPAPTPEQAGTDLSRIVINVQSVNNENFAIFKDESQYYLNSVDTILSHFEDADPVTALKEIDQAIRAVNTASRMIRLQFFNDLCGAYIRSIETVLNKQIMIPPEFLSYYKTAQSYFRDLLSVRPIALSDWQRLIAVLVDTEKNIRNIAETQVRKTEEKPLTEKSLLTREIPPAVTTVHPAQPQSSGNGYRWIDEIQTVILGFFSAGSTHAVPEHEREEPAETPAPEKIEILHESLPEPEIPLPIKEIRKEEIPLKPPEKEPVLQKPVQSGLDLLSIMVNPSGDLTKIKLPTFIEMMNVDPENIPEISHKQIQHFLKKKPEKSILPETTKTRLSPEKTAVQKSDNIPTEQLQTRIQRIRLHEYKFADVDSELLEIFNQESESYFRLFDKAIRRLQSNLKDESALKDIERVSHSIKSSARMLGFEKISGIAACVELLTERYFEKEITFDENLLELFDDIGKTLKSLYKKEQVDITSIAERLNRLENKFAVPHLFTRYILNDAQADILPPEQTEVKPQAEVSGTGDTGAEKEKTTAPAAKYFDTLNIDAELIEIFREEASTYFKLFEAAMKRLTSDPRYREGARDIEKSAHSLRSSSRMIGLHKIASLAKPVEVLAERISKGLLNPDPPVLELLGKAIRNLQRLSDGYDEDIEPLLERLTVLESSVPEATDEASVPEKEDLREGLTTLHEDSGGEELVRKAGKIKKKPSKKQPVHPFSDIEYSDDPILKHAAGKPDNLLDEMFVNSLNQNTESQKEVNHES